MVESELKAAGVNAVGSSPSPLRARVLTAAVLLVMLLSALFFAPAWLWSALMLGVTLYAAWEWAGIARLTPARRFGFTAASAAIALALLIAYPRLGASADVRGARLLPLFAVAGLFWLTIVPVWLMRRWRRSISPEAVGWTVLMPTLAAMLFLRDLGPSVLLAVLGIVWIADTCAYFVGRKLGRHKLAPAISPGKTWEGVGGALLGVLVYVVALWSMQPGATSSLALLVFAGWVLTAFAIIGDLFESWLKRVAGVKDSGRILPGHGGVLDRIDALTSTLPLAALLILAAGRPAP